MSIVPAIKPDEVVAEFTRPGTALPARIRRVAARCYVIESLINNRWVPHCQVDTAAERFISAALMAMAGAAPAGAILGVLDELNEAASSLLANAADRGETEDEETGVEFRDWHRLRVAAERATELLDQIKRNGG